MGCSRGVFLAHSHVVTIQGCEQPGYRLLTHSHITGFWPTCDLRAAQLVLAHSFRCTQEVVLHRNHHKFRWGVLVGRARGNLTCFRHKQHLFLPLAIHLFVLVSSYM